LLRNRDSFLLHNVTNVQFHLEKDSAGSNNNQIYNFEQILLRDAVIKESWELNGKTYGIITGKLLGKVKDEVKPPDPTNPQEPTKPPPIISNPHNIQNGNLGCLNIGNGCMPSSGCISTITGSLSRIWRLLLALMLFFFLLWLFKSCLNKKEVSENCCGDRSRLETENRRLQHELDSIKTEGTQKEINELSSKVYFYGGTVKIRKFSEDQLNKIVDILKKNNTLKIQVRGFYNGNGTPINVKEYGATIDLARAEYIREILIKKGVDENLVSAVGMGESTLDPSDEDSMQMIEVDGEVFKWNRNMRVEIKIVKD
jgi:outer membrane protein OmpA-like peptidoglycan-associated protein